MVGIEPDTVQKPVSDMEQGTRLVNNGTTMIQNTVKKPQTDYALRANAYIHKVICKYPTSGSCG
jgi:hypothetical protein